MKIFFLLLIMPLFSNAQVKDTSFDQIDTRLKNASIEMIKFDKQFHTGVMLEIIGGVVVGAGSVKSVQPMIIAGGVLTFFGFIMNVSSSDHIRKAGIILRGNSIVIPLKHH